MKNFKKSGNINTVTVMLIMMSLVLVACGGSAKKEVTVSASGVHISGDGSEYIKVVDGSYTLKLEDKENVSIALKLETAKPIDIATFRRDHADMKNDSKLGLGNIRLILTDKYGGSLGDSYYPDRAGDSKISELLTSSTGTQLSVTFHDFYIDKKTLKSYVDAKSFELSGADITYDKIKAEETSTSINDVDLNDALKAASTATDALKAVGSLTGDVSVSDAIKAANATADALKAAEALTGDVDVNDALKAAESATNALKAFGF